MSGGQWFAIVTGPLIVLTMLAEWLFHRGISPRVLLCAVGLHRWKPVWRAVKVLHSGFYWDTGEPAEWVFDAFVTCGHKCRRCGTRRPA